MFKVAGIQFYAKAAKADNIKKAVEFAERAIVEGAKIILLGELFSCPWFLDEYSIQSYIYAEKVPGESTRPFMALAKRYNISFVCPILEKSDIEGIYYNTAVVISSKGEIQGTYRKIHLPDIDGWREKKYFAKGDRGFPVFSNEWANFGILMGWDNFFPEAARVLALKGAGILLCPTTSAHDTHDIWEVLIKANSITNNVHSFRLNRVGSEKGLDFYGKSFCTNPFGDLLFSPATRSEGIIIAEIISGIQSSIRNEWTVIKDRSPSDYLPIMPPSLRAFWKHIND